jgi:hypothetical protein
VATSLTRGLAVFNAVISYLIDSYLLFAASALAANAVLRSLLGAVFPLVSPCDSDIRLKRKTHETD